MSKLTFTFILAVASICLAVSSGGHAASAQKSVSAVAARGLSQASQRPAKPYLQAHSDAVVAASTQSNNSNQPSNGKVGGLRLRSGHPFGDLRDVLGMTRKW